ncbi:hypothetical protein G6679_00070 [Polynucleobacter paneuropaeus]|nr:hypothetical protein [Polynucleobacter paneuropaeus]
MGQVVKVSCKCGLETSTTIGGNRANYMKNSTFPFYCEKDGLISVNYREEIKCPYCQSKEIRQYGKLPISIGEDRFPAIQSFDYKANKQGNLCPKCKEMTLEFGPTLMMFD